MTTNHQTTKLQELNSNSNHPTSGTLPNNTQLDVASSSPRKMIYLFINAMDFECSGELLSYINHYIKLNPTINCRGV